jgi:hypothetical protein
MTKQATFSFLAILILSFIGCKNKETNETTTCINKQLPGEYFPAFPKSWWNYRKNNNELVQYKISDDYQDCEGKCRPVFVNLNKCIQGESFFLRIYTGLGESQTVPSPIYSLFLDSVLICPISFATFKENIYFTSSNGVHYRRVTIKIDTNITLPNSQTFSNVIIVKEYSIYDSNHVYLDYFAKNIGLIKRDSININDKTDLIQILMLENYQIGK